MMASAACVGKRFVKIAKRPAEDPSRLLQNASPYYVNMPGGGRCLANLRRSMSLQDNRSHYVVMVGRPRSVPEKIPPSMKVPTTLSLSPAMPRHKIQQLGSPSQLQRPLPELPPLNSPPSIPSSLAPDLPVNAANSLKKAPWFFSIERLQAIQLLEDCGLDGCFLIRKSSQKDAVYTLSVMHKGRIYHIPIRKRADDLYALGKLKENEQAFPSVEGMVTFYSKEILKLYSGGKPSGETLLKMSPSAERM